MTADKTPHDDFSATITETVATLKAKAKQWHLEERIDDLTETTGRAVQRTVEHAGELAYTKRDHVVTLLDKAESAIDSRTEGRYADRVGAARSTLLAGVDRLAAKRPQPQDAVPDPSGESTD